MSESAETTPSQPRYDLLLVSENVGHRIAPKGGEALLRHMALGKLLRVVDESVADEWVEVYCEPDVSSHEFFVTGSAPEGDVPFVRATVRFGLKPVEIPYGDGRETNFFIELAGATRTDVNGKFKNKFREILLARPVTFTQEHTALRPARPVGDDEKPKTRERRERGTAKAGTRVEEW